VILFSAVSLTSSLTYFEYKNDSNNPSARVTSRPQFLLNLYQLIVSICVTYFSGIELKIILLAVMLVGSALLFIQFHFSFPFHDEALNKTWSILTAMNMWTAFLLVFAMVLEDILFKGTVIAWIIGLPFIAYIMYDSRDHRTNLLVINSNRFKNGLEIQKQARYVYKLMQMEASNKNAKVLLKGYIEVHKKSCNKDDCPLRQKMMKNNRFAKTLMTRDENMNERLALYIQLLYKTYSEGVAKFPKDVSLRISYAFFLFEKMHNRQQALQELFQAELNKPSIDEEFIIFRYKKIIEDEIAESKNEANQGGMDVVSEMTFHNQLRQIQANIEKSTLLYMEFWSQLTEETPDLAKLNDIGSKINASIQTVEENWAKLLKVNPNNVNAIKLYGKFLLEIINDKESGDSLLEKARNLANAQANNKAANVLEGAGDDDNQDTTATIWMSGEQETLGVMTGINLSAATLFGYNKTELINKKVNALMPEVYGEYHDSFIENYLNMGESSLIARNKERLVFGKHKTEYVFPTYVSIKFAQSVMQGVQFIASFRVEKNFKSTAYVLTKPDGTIDSLTASCMTVLKIDQKAVSKKANIEDFIPQIISHRIHLFSGGKSSGKSTLALQYNYPKDSEYYYADREKASATLNVQLKDITFLGGKKNAGLQFRFDYVHEKVVGAQDLLKTAKLSNFQFRHDWEQPKASFLGEYITGDVLKESDRKDYNDDMLSDDVKSSDLDGSFIRADSKQVDDIWKVKPPQKEEEGEKYVEERRKNYGVGIKTYKLFKGKAQDIDDSRSDEDEADEEGASAQDNADGSINRSSLPRAKKSQEESHVQKEEENQDDTMADFGNNFKSRKQLSMAVSDRTAPGTVKSLKNVVNLLCLLLGLVAVLNYVIANKEFNAIEDKINLLDVSNQNLVELMNVLSRLRDTHLYNIGLTTAVDSLSTIKSSMLQSLNAAKGYIEYLSSESNDLFSEHYSLLNDPVIKLTAQDGTETHKGLIQAAQELISTGFSLVSQSGVTASDADYYTVTYNFLNDFYLGLRDSSNYYTLEMYQKVDDQLNSFMIMLIASILVLLLALFALFVIFYQINKSREAVLSLFLDIPEKTVKSLFSKCETFITNLQIGEEEEAWSQIDDEEDLDKTQQGESSSNLHEFIPRKKRKHFKNSGRSQKAFFFKFIVLAVLIEGFFIYNYVSVDVLLADVSEQLIEFNATSTAQSFYSFSNNALKQIFIDSTIPVKNAISFNVATINNKAMYDLDAEILHLHAINRNIHSNDYSEVFNQIMMANPCGYITSATGKGNCPTFAGKSVSQGISVASTKYFEDLRTLQRCYNKTINGLTCAIDLVTTVSIPGYTTTQNLLLGLFLTNEGQESAGLVATYFQPTLQTLVSDFKSSFHTQLKNTLTIRLVVFILFLVVVGVIYVLLWLPLVQKVNNDIWRTKSMLSMIPLGVIAKIKSIRMYLKKFWANQHETAM
jgi:PAS domain S-box-containing protein